MHWRGRGRIVPDSVDGDAGVGARLDRRRGIYTVILEEDVELVACFIAHGMRDNHVAVAVAEDGAGRAAAQLNGAFDASAPAVGCTAAELDH